MENTSLKTDILISVVAVVNHDNPYIAEYIADVSAVLGTYVKDYEIILIANGTTEAELEEIEAAQKKYKNIQLYALALKSDEEVALVAGLDNAIGDFVVTLDPLTDPPSLIPQMVERAQAGADIVYGAPSNRAGKGATGYDKGAVLFYRFFEKITGIALPSDNSGYRLYSRAIVNFICGMNDRHRLLKVLPAFAGYRHASIPYDLTFRGETAPKRTIFKGFLQGLSLIFITSIKPLRFATMLAVLAGFLNLLYAIYVVIVALFKRQVAEGWVSLSLQNSGMFFLLSVILAIISEYIFHVMEAAQNRPIYKITKESSSTVFARKKDPNVQQ